MRERGKRGEREGKRKTEREISIERGRGMETKEHREREREIDKPIVIKSCLNM